MKHALPNTPKWRQELGLSSKPIGHGNKRKIKTLAVIKDVLFLSVVLALLVTIFQIITP